jgi:hypothetical protein
MAATYEPYHPAVHLLPINGATVVTAGFVTFDNSYPTGGEAVTASLFGLDTIYAILPLHSDEAGVTAEWDRTNSKIILNDEDNTSGIEAEFANAGDASGVVLPVLVLGEKRA